MSEWDRLFLSLERTVESFAVTFKLREGRSSPDAALVESLVASDSETTSASQHSSPSSVTPMGSVLFVGLGLRLAWARMAGRIKTRKSIDMTVAVSASADTSIATVQYIQSAT